MKSLKIEKKKKNQRVVLQPYWDNSIIYNKCISYLRVSDCCLSNRINVLGLRFHCQFELLGDVVQVNITDFTLYSSSDFKSFLQRISFKQERTLSLENLPMGRTTWCPKPLGSHTIM
ncbi:hypothetical protein U1Q18_016137 [Sarracenia purpurea var. burkii]